MWGGTHMFAIRKDRVSFTGLAKGAAVLALGFATSAVAQTTTTQDPAASTPREARANVDDGIDIVVTATRQEQVLSRVPVSVSAFSQTNMDQKGVKSSEDLARFTPGVTFGAGENKISIPGISSGPCARTTGVYRDATPTQMPPSAFLPTNYSQPTF